MQGTPWEYPAHVSTHAWSEHVVHVDLMSRAPEIAAEAKRFLEGRFADRDPEGHAEPGTVRVHSLPDRPVTAGDVARALAEAGVRARSVHERVEWSVADVGPVLSNPQMSLSEPT